MSKFVTTFYEQANIAWQSRARVLNFNKIQLKCIKPVNGVQLFSDIVYTDTWYSKICLFHLSLFIILAEYCLHAVVYTWKSLLLPMEFLLCRYYRVISVVALPVHISFEVLYAVLGVNTLCNCLWSLYCLAFNLASWDIVLNKTSQWKK